MIKLEVRKDLVIYPPIGLLDDRIVSEKAVTRRPSLARQENLYVNIALYKIP